MEPFDPPGPVAPRSASSGPRLRLQRLSAEADGGSARARHVGPALARAVARLDAFRADLRRGRTDGSDPTANLAALGCLAIGDVGTARRLLARSESDEPARITEHAVPWADRAGEAERAYAGWARALEADSPSLGQAAGVAVGFVYGLLGAEPDAEREWLRLRPWLPADWTSLDVDRLHAGGVELALRYRRDGRRHSLRLEQSTGAVPYRAVLEPLLPGRRLLEARVEEQEVRLDARPIGDRLIVPLQVVLDHERTIELVVGD